MREEEGAIERERERDASPAPAEKKKKKNDPSLSTSTSLHQRRPAATSHAHSSSLCPPAQCPFYFKIGACRHGDRCSRQHNKPTISPTILLPHLYVNPALPATAEGTAILDGSAPAPVMDPAAAQAHFEAFYEDLAAELVRYGRLEGLHVCDNLSDHLVGSVYAAFADEDGAARALTDLSNRFYDGRPIRPEFSPVTDFREAACRQYETSHCGRGGYCNFMHLRPVSRGLAEAVFGPGGGGLGGGERGGGGGGRRGRGEGGGHRGGGGPRRRSSRSRSRSRDRDRDRGGDRGRGRRRSPSPLPPPRETSEERRRKIEAWNRGEG